MAGALEDDDGWFSEFVVGIVKVFYMGSPAPSQMTNSTPYALMSRPTESFARFT